MVGQTNSKVTRVQPIFGWLRDQGGTGWAQRLVTMAEGLAHTIDCGPVERVHLDPEMEIAPSPVRLAWMIRNVDRLAPQDGRKWQEPSRRISDASLRDRALGLLDSGKTAGVHRDLIFEGPTHADCLVMCERAVIWIEGKRSDWLSPCTGWDVTRDQLARNVEAAWLFARAAGKADYCVIVCHEGLLKHHETALIEGYRQGTWAAGWPHLPETQRRAFGQRIGTLTWGDIAGAWPELRALPALHDLGTAPDAASNDPANEMT